MRPFFILGAPRSGTSLLSRMLDSHPAVAVPDETKIFETFAPLLPLYGDLRQPGRLRRLVDDILGWRWIRRLPHVPAADAVLARVARPDLGGVFAALLDCWTEAHGKKRWGEKTPNNVYFWPEIEAAFPDAAAVHILRDGRDVAISQIKAPFGPKSMATAAERWMSFVGAARAIGERIGPERFVEIRYEDLLAAPEATITGILRLIGEPFDPAVLNFHERRRPVGTDPVNDRNIQKPLQAANSGKWEAEVGRHEIEVFEAIAGSMLDMCGYQRATAALPMTAAERKLERYLRHPPRKVAAMLRNHAGIAEGLERTRIKWRLRMDGLTGSDRRQAGTRKAGAAGQR
ncbi:MAG: sulfotransferase [Geminicoccaceae bacterium]